MADRSQAPPRLRMKVQTSVTCSGASLPSTSGQAGRLTREQRLRRRAEDAMRDLGFDVVVNLSLTDPALGRRLAISDEDPRAQPIRVSNPLSAEHSVERTAMTWR